jgi:hypothetical protein
VSTYGWLCSGGPLATCDLRQPLRPPMTSSDRAGALPWSEVVLSYKTNGEGNDGHDIDEDSMRGIELCGGFLVTSFSHPISYILNFFSDKLYHNKIYHIF